MSEELIARLEKNTGPGRGHDLRIHIALFDPEVMVDGGGYHGERPVKHQKASAIWNDAWPHWGSKTDVEGIALHIGAPAYTASIDAALTLAPENWFVDHIGEKTKPISFKDEVHSHLGWIAYVQHRKGGRLQQCHHASTPALALCIAALKARLTHKTAEGQ